MNVGSSDSGDIGVCIDVGSEGGGDHDGDGYDLVYFSFFISFLVVTAHYYNNIYTHIYYLFSGRRNI